MKNKSFAEKLKNIFLIYTVSALLFASIAFATYVSDQKINGEARCRTGSVPVKTIVPAMTSFDFNVEIISGAQNTTQANQLKLLFIGTGNMNIINKPAYDFYSGIDNADFTDVDIGMFYI